MPATSRSIIIRSLNAEGGIRDSRAGLSATVELVAEKESWVVPVWDGFAPKVGDKLIPIATDKIKDKTPRTITAVATADNKYTITCNPPPA